MERSSALPLVASERVGSMTYRLYAASSCREVCNDGMKVRRVLQSCGAMAADHDTMLKWKGQYMRAMSWFYLDRRRTAAVVCCAALSKK